MPYHLAMGQAQIKYNTFIYFFQLKNLNKSKIIPVIEPIKYINDNILMFSFISLFSLNNTIMAIPEPVKTPASIDPKLIDELKYNSVIKILEAQLGINPIKLDIKGLKREFFKRSLLILSVPK